MQRALSLVTLWICSVAGFVSAQQPVTRADAVAAALARGARAALGRADTAAAAGVLHSARLYPNPTLAATYTQDVPHYHVIADVPLDLPWLRAARIGAAASARDAARYGFAFERAAIRFDVDTTYTRALAALARARLSRRNARDADSLLKMAQLRREVGDVSELDVRLAAVSAVQLENAAADDSLAAIEALLAVQLAMGLPAQQPTITLADSLAPPTDTLSPAPGEPPSIAAAAASLRSAERALTLAHRSAFAAPSLQVGVETGDPTQGGPLPTIGFSLPFPLFNWNGGEVAQATAARDRAQANLDLVRRETAAELARAQRGLAVTIARMERDRRLLASADRVAMMSLQAYAEGAVALPNVLEAQRNAREALGRYVDDVAAASNAAASVRLLTAWDQP
jgi:outer membrane protein, heavy metal efflux system